MNSRMPFISTAGVVLALVVILVELPLIALFEQTRLMLVELGFSCVSAILAFLCCRRMGRRDEGQTVFGLPLVILGVLCLGIQLVINIVSVAIGGKAEPAAYVVSTVILLATSAVLLMTNSSIIHEQNVEESAQQRTSRVNAWRKALTHLRADCEGQLSRAIASVEEQLRFTNPTSSQLTYVIDSQIDEELAHLEKVASDTMPKLQEGMDSCERLSRLIEARDRVAKA